MAGKTYRARTLRMMAAESAIIDRACAALNGMERSQLIQEAALSEAGRLGIRWTVGPPKPLATTWPYHPDRKDEVTEMRVTMTLSLPLCELVTRCAEHVHASEPMFLVGATLAYVGRLQKCFRAIHAESPEEANAILTKLRKIKLPAQYEYRASVRE